MRLQYNAPVVLTFTLLCTAVMAMKSFLFIDLTPYFFIGGTMDPTNIIDYFRLVSHTIGHGNWEHLVANMSYILLLGPILEEKYGSKPLLMMMLLTALITGLLNVIVFDDGLLGASGIVFMFILLSSVVNVQKGRIPMTFVLVLMLFLGQEIISIFRDDNISQFAHILGGICGAIFGFNSSLGKPGKKRSKVKILS
ncbi:rhomboid family intramembrane serine protease [Limibacter armeniacum]|uniref:rhomboid family intramembrane serine protease n=1 Tax=Limibacter armeniacum TaxID=466084 RepID=UPI002FE58A13